MGHEGTTCAATVATGVTWEVSDSDRWSNVCLNLSGTLTQYSQACYLCVCRVSLQRYICWMHTAPVMLLLVQSAARSLTTKQASDVQRWRNGQTLRRFHTACFLYSPNIGEGQNRYRPLYNCWHQMVARRIRRNVLSGWHSCGSPWELPFVKGTSPS